MKHVQDWPKVSLLIADNLRSVMETLVLFFKNTHSSTEKSFKASLT